MLKRSLILCLFVMLSVRAEDAAEDSSDDDASSKGHKHEDVSENRQIGGYKHLVVTGAFKVIVRLEKPELITITAAHKKVLRNVVTEVIDGVLYIRLEDSKYVHNYGNDIEIVICIENLVSIEANGASSVVVQGALRGKVIRLTTNGACRISTEVYCKKLYSQINGAGVIDVSGRAHFASIKIVGSGRYNALNLETDKTKIDIYGSGDLSIWANEKIFGTVEGSAIVVHKDKPDIDVDVNGSAVFRKVGAAASPYEEKIISNIMSLQKSFFAGSLVDMS